MWLMTTKGFYSVVEKPEDIENETLTVRARCYQDLANIKDLTHEEPYEIDNSDYSWRIKVNKYEWADIVAQLTREIDYDNFKNEISNTNKHRANVYSNVWIDLLRIENEDYVIPHKI